MERERFTSAGRPGPESPSSGVSIRWLTRKVFQNHSGAALAGYLDILSFLENKTDRRRLRSAEPAAVYSSCSAIVQQADGHIVYIGTRGPR